MKKIKFDKKYMIGAIVIGSLLLIAIVVGVFFLLKDDKPVEKKPDKVDDSNKSVQIVDLNSDKRPIAVMINNNRAAWPQSGLKDAYLIYEIMVEGGITRMMALYTQDAKVDKIGSVRSSRHNYLDYVMENDAIYVHWGGSYVAYAHLKELGLDRLDGITYEGKYFTRDKTLKRATEHTGFTSTDLIHQGIEKLKLRTTTDKGYLLNYSVDEVDLSKKEGAEVANTVAIKYSNYQTSSYEYNSEDKMYYRSMSGQKHVDLVTGEQYKFKNIIAYDVQYNDYDEKLKDLQNIGEGKGVYITNGYSIPIKWSKKDRESKTKYMYLDGTEIDVSDGNTFIQIYPKTGTLTIG